jgi:hypothetical protein
MHTCAGRICSGSLDKNTNWLMTFEGQRMKNRILLSISLATMFSCNVAVAAPPITGTPVTDSPALLEWPTDRGLVEPNLNDATSNNLNDLHGHLDNCDMVLSTEGNYHPALRDIWPVYLAKFQDKPLSNWVYSTSPPVVVKQLTNKQLGFGNYSIGCMPSVAVASKQVIDKLVATGWNDGEPIPLYRDRGNVILVKHGNPKHIRTVWDLGRKDVRVVTPNYILETGAFNNYAQTIYAVAANDPHAPKDINAEALFNYIFNDKSGVADKWLQGERIHHRDVPWSIAYGRGDASVILYHLALYMKQTFPDKFDIIPIGGTVSDPQLVAGETSSVRYMVKLNGNWTPRQIEARDKLVDTLQSQEFTDILHRRGLLRPEAGHGGVASK